MIFSNVSDALVSTLKSWGLWSAIVASIIIIFLGYFLAYKKIFKQEWEIVMIKIVLVVGIPALALKGFLSNTSVEDVKSELVTLLIGFLFHAVMTFVGKYMFYKYDKDIRDTLTMSVTLASTTFMGIPILISIYSDSINSTNMFNISYRVFLYGVAFIIMSKSNIDKTIKKAKKEYSNEEIIEAKKLRKQILKNIFVNPIVIATLIGFFIWITQLIPGINCLSINGETKKFSPLRFDLLFPPFNTILITLQALCTPLAWLAIGMTMNRGNLKEAIKDKTIWYASFIKIFVAPLLVLILTFGFAAIGYYSSWFSVKKVALASMVIMIATPPASVIVAYSISYNKAPMIASNLTTLSTFFAIFAIPIWVIIVTAIGSMDMFV
ncbi:malate permease [Spiroplasma gladiatoris]|uniref:Malate permease n=1 Tax=Spiroplasma gladiatoris TaxID=2143 RepID=A0A4P7AHT9_9MOLU|nr:AEC family transporter [Spiroplasma gladiatoris]QBQ07782.1 malate permease [Spiroplasma gladiatoris]